MSEVLVADAGFVIARQVQMQIQPELERNPASGQAISASERFDLRRSVKGDGAINRAAAFSTTHVSRAIAH